jgi:hypothetical protein
LRVVFYVFWYCVATVLVLFCLNWYESKAFRRPLTKMKS